MSKIFDVCIGYRCDCCNMIIFTDGNIPDGWVEIQQIDYNIHFCNKCKELLPLSIGINL